MHQLVSQFLVASSQRVAHSNENNVFNELEHIPVYTRSNYPKEKGKSEHISCIHN